MSIRLAAIIILMMLVAVMSSIARAESVLITCEAPTMRTDGSAVESLDGFQFTIEQPGRTLIQEIVPTCRYETDLAEDSYRVAVTAIEAGRMSTPAEVLGNAAPNSPTNLNISINISVQL